METIGERLKKTRMSKGVTQEALASILGVTKQNVSSIENNKSFLSASALSKLVTELNVNLNYLVTGIGSPFLEIPTLEDTFVENNFEYKYSMTSEIGKRLRQFMAYNKMNDLELANKTGISANRINDICVHNKTININELYQLKTKYSNLSLDWLLFGNKPSAPENKDISLSDEEIIKLKKILKFID